MDKTDRKILSLLQDNARLTYKEIASEINLTPTPVYDRIKKMEREGIIEKYVTLVNPEKLNALLIIFCQISLINQTLEYSEPFEKAMKNLPEVMQCHFVSGNFDYLIKIAVPDMAYYHIFHQSKLSAIPGIRLINSYFMMSEVKASSALPIY